MNEEIVFPERKYERSIFVKCNCGSVEELPTDESEPIKITGKSKNIAEGSCTVCKKKIVVYALIWIR